MGKVLIIKGADFSEVAVKEIPIDGKVDLTRANYTQQIGANILISSQGNYYQQSSYAKASFWNIRQGQALFVPGNNTKNQTFGLVKNATVGEAIVFAEDCGYVSRDAGTNGDVVLIANEDCLVMMQTTDASLTDLFCDGAYIINGSAVERLLQLTQTDYSFYADSVYLKSDGTWGATTQPAGEHSCLFFIVQAGDEVAVKAQSDKRAFFAFRTFDTVLVNTTFAQDGSRYAVEAGETTSVLVEQECALYVFNYDGNVNYFPESITITRT